jgi:hypothetical protein
MKRNQSNLSLVNFKNYSLKNLNSIVGGDAGDPDDDDTEKKGLKVPTNG